METVARVSARLVVAAKVCAIKSSVQAIAKNSRAVRIYTLNRLWKIEKSKEVDTIEFRTCPGSQ